MDQARLIIDPPADGAWNMSVDQALLETANETGVITLRFYSWSEPTLSLGYFQSHQDRSSHPPSLPCPMVRRRTGGGAILHHHEITYSLCIPSKHRWSQQNSELYRLIHQIMIEYFSTIGIETVLYEHEQKTAEHEERPIVDQNAFLCFQRRSDGDITLDRFKIVGSAQRRLKNALLQHGSILLKASNHAPSLPGIEDLCGFPIAVAETTDILGSLIKSRLRISFKNGMLSESEKETAHTNFSSLFSSDSWNKRR